MRRPKKDFQVFSMGGIILHTIQWARNDWNHCVVCNTEFRYEKFWSVFEFRHSVDFCMKCCKTRDEAEEAYEKHLEDRKNFRPPAPKAPPQPRR